MNKNIFTEHLQGETRTSLDNEIAALTSTITPNPMTARAASVSYSTESLTDSDKVLLSSELKAITQGIMETYSSESIHAEGGIENYRVKGAAISGLLASDLNSHFRAALKPATGREPGIKLMNANAEGNVRYSPEAYDNSKMENAVAFSIAYTISALKGSSFQETLYPTICFSPSDSYVEVSADIYSVFDNHKRQISGDFQSFGKRNLLRALADSTILHKDKTKIVPVVRPDSLKYFADPAFFAPAAIMVDKESVTTAPLKFGVEFDMLSISQTDTMLESGLSDTTDSISPSPSIASISFIIGGVEAVTMNVLSLPYTTFTPAPQGIERNTVLNFTSDSLLLTNKTLTTAGIPLATLPSVATGDYSVRFYASVSGNCNLELGKTSLFGGIISVRHVYDKDGVILDHTVAGPAKTIADTVNAMAFGGFTFKGTRTNSNLMQQGQRIDVTKVKEVYNVLLGSPINAASPVGENGQRDTSDLNQLLFLSRVRSENDCVTALFEAKDALAQFKDVRDDEGKPPDVLGFGRHFVIPQFIEEHVKMVDLVATLDSSRQAGDIREAITNKVRSIVYSLYAGSEYKAASDVFGLGESTPVEVILACGVEVSKYLQIDGEVRPLGCGFNARIVTHLDNRLKNKLFICFGVFNAETRNTVPNPLNHGSRFYMPEVVTKAMISAEGTVSNMLFVQPRYLYVTHLPIMGFLTFEGFKGMGNKLPFVP